MELVIYINMLAAKTLQLTTLVRPQEKMLTLQQS